MTESLKWLLRKRSENFFWLSKISEKLFKKSCSRKVIDFEVIIIRNISKINNFKYQTEPYFFVAPNRDSFLRIYWTEMALEVQKYYHGWRLCICGRSKNRTVHWADFYVTDEKIKSRCSLKICSRLMRLWFWKKSYWR